MTDRDAILRGADHVMAQLTEEDIRYADNFSMLHDLMDANMLLPDTEADLTEERIAFLNEVIEEVNRRLKK